jgi:hypothetical protein
MNFTLSESESYCGRSSSAISTGKQIPAIVGEACHKTGPGPSAARKLTCRKPSLMIRPRGIDYSVKTTSDSGGNLTCCSGPDRESESRSQNGYRRRHRPSARPGCRLGRVPT